MLYIVLEYTDWSTTTTVKSTDNGHLFTGTVVVSDDRCLEKDGVSNFKTNGATY